MKVEPSVRGQISGWIFNVGWALLLLLGIGAFLITAGNSDDEVDPSVSSYKVSGASALADLLRLRGYEVIVDSHQHPKLKGGDAVIAFTIVKEDAADATRSAKASNDPDSDDLTPTPEDPSLITEQFVDDATKTGLLTFWLPISSNFETASQGSGKPLESVRLDGKIRKLSGADVPRGELDDAAVSLATVAGKPVITAEKQGSGYEISYANGMGLTNRFLDSGDNAQFFMETLKAYAPNAKRVVFTEGTFGKILRPGLLETIGPWAEGAWYQFLFLLLMIVWTLNRRFGLPRLVRRRQSGGRELVDAFTDTMIRARATGMILENSLANADLRMRKILKIRPDTPLSEREALIPQSLSRKLNEVRAAAAMKRVRPSDALDLVKSLEKQLEEFQWQRNAVADPSRKDKILL